MRCAGYAALLVIAVTIMFAGSNRTDGEEPNAAPAPLTEKEKEAKLKIVPVLVIKPGEERELTLSTECTLGLTRGGGFNLREMDGKGEESPQESRVWKREGVTVEVPDTIVGPMLAESPEYKPLKDAGVNVFQVKVTTTKEAKPGVYNLHLVDQTCSGWCSTDFRVLVVAGKTATANKSAANAATTNTTAAKPTTEKKLVLKEYPPLPYPPGHNVYVELLEERLGIEYEVPKKPEGVSEKDFIEEVHRHNEKVRAILMEKHGAKIFEELHKEAAKKWQDSRKPANP